MAIRDELVTSAVSFLQDPSVASAPLDKKIAFLESKNLTKAEVEASLARLADPSLGNPIQSAPQGSAVTQYQFSRPAQQHSAQQYAPYPQNGWPQQLAPELPKRDWRDWFIMATVVGGVSYGLYFAAKRYILPKLSPPTPDQLTKDKESIDADFQKAFALLDQLSADTSALKTAEDTRTQRLDTALTELETVLDGLKESDRKREDDARRNTDEIRSLRDLIPQALDQQKRSSEERLKDLGNELKSLKTLVGNRMAAPPPTSSSAIPSASYQSAGSSAPAVQPPMTNGTNGVNGTSNYQPPSVSAAITSTTGPSSSSGAVQSRPNHKPNPSTGSSGSSTNGLNGSVPATGLNGSSSTSSSYVQATSPDPSSPTAISTPSVENSSTLPSATPATTSAAAISQPDRPMSSFGSRFGSGKAAIPAWQMAAAKKQQAASNAASSVDGEEGSVEAGAA